MTSPQDRHRAALEQAEASLAEARERAARNPWRLRYHPAAPAYWINDPNGFCFFRGEYHLFYQHHPFSSEWGPMYWGHLKSRDLAHWEHLPVALAPSEDYDADGCFSGSAIEKDGRLWLMYTGNRWTGPDRDADLLQVQALAVSDDGVSFEKFGRNPVIAEAPQGDIHAFHFRDPKVWEHDGSYYCVLGSRTQDHRGQALLYRSADLIDWTFVGVMAGGREDADILGYMWECPDLFALGGQEILAFSPQGVAPRGDLYRNLHQAGYLLGRLDYGTGIFEHGGFVPLDYGFDFYAPQTMEDDRGRRVLIAWMAMWESEMPERAGDWAGAMTLPRVLTLENGRLLSRPAPELAQLRGEEVRHADVTVGGAEVGGMGTAEDQGGGAQEHTAPASGAAAAEAASGGTFRAGSAARRGKALPGVSGECLELEVEFDAGTASAFGLALRVGEARGEETVLAYDRTEERLLLDRERSGAGPGGVRRAPLPLREGRLRLRVFLDRSSVEVFAGDGELAMTARVYPDAGSTGIRFFADGGVAEIVSLSCWTLDR
ncbi:glycoside hydrolase family 32 protein [Saccharibacillus alkalitolerans]|uniref:Sucrose-6-phosphate hydrolase n=1 Tax=Saccharibacillus alkalitolerans TaxID=2705290 RepID=A0ABX0F0J7_9BACL|nr:sucrose-6-phosphate hydrolase [Saccharibacillus alkalitolerans]NGZ73948.1 sucrose-6-phosphate hydrolase [Saccharibacillus alkalitolerans]